MINPLLFLCEVEEKLIQEAKICVLKLTMQILNLSGEFWRENQNTRFIFNNFFFRDRDSTAVKVLCYKSEGTWFDPSGRGRSVGITTDYGLDGLGSNPGGDEIFRPSRPALGSNQPPVKWVPGLSRG